ncbi:MAG: FkbM family methyltransferase [Alphaproteobacteria bacterium]|nr:FkbM family methyltransferase [Alphaproteobacteria bacterium]
MAPSDGIRVRTKDCRHGKMSYLAHDLYVGRSLDLYGEFSEDEARLFRQLVRDGSVVLEAGANIGALTVPLARAAGATGRVIAYEPQAAMAALLRHNLAANGLGAVDVRQAALGRAPGTLRVPPLDYQRPGNFGGVVMGAPTDDDGAPVPVETIDALALPRLDLLKIDVEGMELEVLTGARETIVRLQPVLYVENDRPQNATAVITEILALGYRAWWHFPALFNPDNFFGNRNDVFPNIQSENLLCMPAGRAPDVRGGIPVAGPDDSARAARLRARPPPSP